MATEVDICNTGLAHLGDPALVSSISPPDGSAQAAHCKRFYPMARDEVLEMHTWRFNTVRAILALHSISPPTGWAFAYACPSSMVKAIALLSPSQLPIVQAWEQCSPQFGISNLSDVLNEQDFLLEASPIDGTPVIYTNVEGANLMYSIGVTDTTKFTPLVAAAIARLLAAKLAGPIIKGTTGVNVSKGHLDIFAKVDFPNAVKSDSNARQASPYTSAMPAGIAARL